MIRILLKILSYKFFRLFGWPRLLPMNLTASLTYRCNSRCKTCNLWQRKAGEPELTYQEWNKIFQNLGKAVNYLTLSGGEPFLRYDIVEICQSAYHYCQPAMITIPTNSLLSKQVVEKTKKIVQSCPKTQIIINLSVDEVEGRDGEIRGIPNHFQKFMDTYTGLKKLKFKNLTVGFHTVISKFNVANFPQVAQTLLGLNPDSYVSEIAEERKELGTIGAEISPSVKDYSLAIDFLSEKLKKQKISGFGKITKAFRLEYYSLVKKILSQKRQVIPCFAGWASAQIAPNGDVWGCCVKADVYGNLKRTGYNFSKIWFSKNAEKLRQPTREGICYCPLANASYTNMLLDFKTLIKVGKNFLS